MLNYSEGSIKERRKKIKLRNQKKKIKIKKVIEIIKKRLEEIRLIVKRN